MTFAKKSPRTICRPRRRGAAGGSRTRTPLRALAPEASESTNSTTRASGVSLVATRDILPWVSLFVNRYFQKNDDFFRLTKRVVCAIMNKLELCGCAGTGRLASLRCLCPDGRTGSTPVSRTKKKDICFADVLLFWVPPPVGRLHPSGFQCSGRQSHPCAKVLSCGQNTCTRHSARPIQDGAPSGFAIDQ